MKPKLYENSLVLSLLGAVLLGGIAFWRSTETKLAVQEKSIATLEKQIENLADDLDDLLRMVW